MFEAKRAIPDIHQMIVVLLTWVTKPNKTGCKKLVIMIKYLTVSDDDLKVIKWYVDASFYI